MEGLDVEYKRWRINGKCVKCEQWNACKFSGWVDITKECNNGIVTIMSNPKRKAPESCFDRCSNALSGYFKED